jgi:serine/threonine protein kinase
LIGHTLAHYRITAAIGAGGMGEVYRATDTKLGREVALKVLPAGMARDPDRLARFQREAKAPQPSRRSWPSTRRAAR